MSSQLLMSRNSASLRHTSSKRHEKKAIIGRKTTCYQDTMQRVLPVDSTHSISCIAFILYVTFRHQVPYIYPSPPPGTPKNENMFIFIGPAWGPHAK